MTTSEMHTDEALREKCNGKCILVVDDVEANYELIKAYLRKCDTKILWAANGLEAVEVCQSIKDIDLILMDIRMPVMNGHEATRKIKEINNNQVIIAVTAYTEEEREDKCRASGCSDYVTKPVIFEKLKEMLMKYLK